VTAKEFGGTNECLPLATVQWKHLPDGSEGFMPWKQAVGEGGRIVRTGMVEGAGVTKVAYAVVR